MKISQDFSSDYNQSIILNKVSEHISEIDLKNYFEFKFQKKVREVKLMIDKPVIVFDDEILKSGLIKACFKIGLKNRTSKYRRNDN
jgi:hypothetical protein